MIVKIKTWDQMEKEFGLSSSGSIACQYKFTKEMEKIMPESRIIEINDRSRWDVTEHKIEEKDFFIISNDMIKERIEAKPVLYFDAGGRVEGDITVKIDSSKLYEVIYGQQPKKRVKSRNYNLN